MTRMFELSVLKLKTTIIDIPTAIMDKVDSIQEQMSNVGRQVKILEGPRRNAAAAAAAAAAGSLQLCPTLSDPMDCSLPGSATHGIFQTRVLEWGAIAFSEKKC